MQGLLDMLTMPGSSGFGNASGGTGFQPVTPTPALEPGFQQTPEEKRAALLQQMLLADQGGGLPAAQPAPGPGPMLRPDLGSPQAGGFQSGTPPQYGMPQPPPLPPPTVVPKLNVASAPMSLAPPAPSSSPSSGMPPRMAPVVSGGGADLQQEPGIGQRLKAAFGSAVHGGSLFGMLSNAMDAYDSGHRVDNLGIRTEGTNLTAKALKDRGMSEDDAQAAARNPEMMKQLLPQLFSGQQQTVVTDASGNQKIVFTNPQAGTISTPRVAPAPGTRRALNGKNYTFRGGRWWED